MTDSFWFSALLGASLAAVYSVAALWIGSIAQRSSSRTFMMIVMGGMVARIFVAVITLPLVLLFAPVDQTVLLIAFFAVFTVGLTTETIMLHRRQKDISESESSSATD